MCTTSEKQRGSALITALMLMIVMAALVGLVTVVSFSDAEVSTQMADQSISIQMAESGAGYGRAQLGRHLQLPDYSGEPQLELGVQSEVFQMPVGVRNEDGGVPSGAYRALIEQVNTYGYKVVGEGWFPSTNPTTRARVEMMMLYSPPVPPTPVPPTPWTDFTGDLGAMTLVMDDDTQVDNSSIEIEMGNNSKAGISGSDWDETGTSTTGTGNAPALSHTGGGSLPWTIDGDADNVESGSTTGIGATSTSAPGATLNDLLDEIADTVKQKHDAGSTDIVGMPAGTYSGWGAMGGSGPDNYKVGYSELQPGDSLHFSGNETAYGVLVIDAPNGITGEVLSYQGNPQFSGLIIIRTPTVMTGNKSVVKLTGTGSDPNSVLGGVAMLVEDQINLGKGGLISVGGNGNLRFSSTTVGKAVDAVENIRDPEVPPGVTEPAKWDQLYYKVEPISP